jgi:hypothetical protein
MPAVPPLLPNSRSQRSVAKWQQWTHAVRRAASLFDSRIESPSATAVKTGEEQGYLLWRCLDFVELAEELLPSIFRTVK